MCLYRIVFYLREPIKHKLPWAFKHLQNAKANVLFHILIYFFNTQQEYFYLHRTGVISVNGNCLEIILI